MAVGIILLSALGLIFIAIIVGGIRFGLGVNDRARKVAYMIDKEYEKAKKANQT